MKKGTNQLKESIIKGGFVDESKATAVYYVDIENENASDKNPGTEELPFKNIGKSIEVAMDNNKKGIGTKININPGTYRESIALEENGEETDAPIVIEGSDKGEVVIKGSVVSKDPWSYSEGVYTSQWLLNFETGRDIYAEEYNIRIGEIGRRREMLFIDGKMVTQVLSKEELEEWCFYVDNEEGTITLKSEKEMDFDKSIIEIPVLEYGIRIKGKSNIVLRGLKVTHTNPFFYGPSGIELDYTNNVIIDNCKSEWNNGTGMTVVNSNNVTISNTESNYNGSGGLVGVSDKDILMVDTETSYNNWRGVRADFTDWHPSGIKILFSYSFETLRHKAIGNFSPGIWFDSEIRDIYIRDCIVKDNHVPGRNIIAGIYLEGGIGPFLVSGCEITGNKRGFNLASSTDITIIDCVVANNLESQVGIFGNWGYGRTFKAFEGGEEVTSYLENTIIKDCVIAAPEGDTGPIYDYDHGDNKVLDSWLKTLKTENIKYYHPNPDVAFYMRDSETKAGLAKWQEESGLDKDAIWLDGPYK